MKKTLLATLITMTSFSAFAGTSASALEASHQPFSSIEPINSSSWYINPVDYGMTPEQFLENIIKIHEMKTNEYQKLCENTIFSAPKFSIENYLSLLLN